jgi:hypothetical protein
MSTTRSNEQTHKSYKILKRENIEIRNQWMCAKTIKNYKTEYDRIRNHLEHSTTPRTTRDQIIKRKETLEDIGARAFDIIG